eukprot:5655591-Prymnesium_polylepis.1
MRIHPESSSNSMRESAARLSQPGASDRQSDRARRCRIPSPMSNSINGTSRQSSQEEEVVNKNVRASRLVNMMMDEDPTSADNSFVFKGSQAPRGQAAAGAAALARPLWLMSRPASSNQ